jgi:hypothetical protein
MEHATTYRRLEMPKWRFLITKCLFPIKNSAFLIISPRAEEVGAPSFIES